MSKLNIGFAVVSCALWLASMAAHDAVYANANAPETPRGKCAQQAGGKYNPSTGQWRTDGSPEQVAKFESCLKARGIASSRSSGRSSGGGCRTSSGRGMSNSGKGAYVGC